MRRDGALLRGSFIAIGGNGTNTTASLLCERGLKLIGVPKTIDNDVWGTDCSLGFSTAVDTATEAIDRLHSTALSHNRCMVVELMGHNAGWLALHAGLAGGAAVILLPEVPYRTSELARCLLARVRDGKRSSIVVVAEGTLSRDEPLMPKEERTAARAISKYPSIGYCVAAEIEGATGLECRVTVLGHLQRGGIPSALDRVLATAFGAAAVELAFSGSFGRMVTYTDGNVDSVSLSSVAGRTRRIPAGHGLLSAARSMGVCLGD